MSYIEEALAKARALAKKAKAQSAPAPSYSSGPTSSSGGAGSGGASSGGGLAAFAEHRVAQGPGAGSMGGGGGGGGRGINHSAPHMIAQAEGRRLFVGGLSYDTTDESLEAYLSTKWPVEEAKVKRDPDGKSRGFAFVTFPVLSILEACFDNQPHWIDGKQVSMRLVGTDGQPGSQSSAPRSSSQPTSTALVEQGTKRPHMGMTRYGGGGSNTTRVYVGAAPSDTSRFRGLSEDLQDEDLRSYFERFGTVTGIAQHRWEDTGRKKGFGYMEFAEYEGAQAAIGIHTVTGKDLEVKPYTQGGARTVSAGDAAQARPAPSYHTSGVSSDYGYGGNPGHQQPAPSSGGYGGYGPEAKRSRGDEYGGGGGGGGGGENPAEMMKQMQGMMQQMQAMQQAMTAPAPPSGPQSMQDQMAAMQATMYAMMQGQYMGGAGAYPGYQQTAQPPNPNFNPKPPTEPYPGRSSSTAYPKRYDPKPPGDDRYST